MNRHFEKGCTLFIAGMTLSMFFADIAGHNLYAQKRPVKEFFVTVQETTRVLLEDPQKDVTVWASALEGEEPSVPGFVNRVKKSDMDTSRMASLPDTQPSEYPTGLVDRGYDINHQHCKACHGNFAIGGFGPALQQSPVLQDDDKFWQTVLKGKGNMPAWEKRLSAPQIANVQAYLKTLKPPPPP